MPHCPGPAIVTALIVPALAVPAQVPADMTLKERALAFATPDSIPPRRYRPTDSLLAFLEGL